MTGQVVIAVVDPRRDDVRGLLEQHRRLASRVMPPQGVHVLAPDDLLDGTSLSSVRRLTASCSASGL